MGREVRRVALDFDWPVEKRWPGFVNPYCRPCPEKDKTCFNGLTAGGAWLEAIVRLLSVACEDAAYPDRNGIYPHPYLQEMPLGVSRPGDHPGIWHRVAPSPDLADLWEGLSGKPVNRFWSGQWEVQKAIRDAAGLGPRWGICPVCLGHDQDLQLMANYACWEPTPPPEGPGWQMWETTSEGSPISPVFETPEELARWLADTGASSCGYQTESYETWLGFITGSGWSATFVGTSEKGLQSGVAYAAEG